MSTQAPPKNHDQTLLPFLPMIYMAWANGSLAPDELDAIKKSIGDSSEISEQTRALLSVWLDPESPPSAHQLQILLGTIRNSAAELPESSRLSLADLGLAISNETNPAVREALEEIQEALGIAGSEASRELLAPTPVPRAETQVSGEPPFAVGAMQDYLEAPYQKERRKMRKFLEHPRFVYDYDLPRAEFRERILNWCKELSYAGFTRWPYPEELGGEENIGGFLAAMQTMAGFDVSLFIKLGVHIGLFGGSVFNLGTERHHKEILPKVMSLELPGCFAMTETGHGSNVRDIETTATFDLENQEFIIHSPTKAAQKDYIGNAARHARIATVFAQLEVDGVSHGVHAFLVPIRDEQNQPLPGITIEDDGAKIGLNGVDNGRILFNRVRVPRENLLDRFAQVSEKGEYTSPIPSPSRRFFTMLGTLVMGRISLAAAANEVSKVGLSIAIKYGDFRRQFGPAGQPEVRLLDYQAHQRQLLPLLANTYALIFANRTLIKRFVDAPEEAPEDADNRDLESLAAGLKAWSTWNTIRGLQTCRECCGGQGYLSENRFGRLKADTDVFATFEGANPVLLQLVAKGLLTEFKHQFSNMKFLGVVRYLTSKVSMAIAEQNPIATRNTDPAHLRDFEFHLAALRYREQSLVVSLARRLKKRLETNEDSFAAFNACQEHAIKMALAHVERVIAEEFQNGVQQAPAELKPALEKLCQLFSLNLIEQDKGWFMESGYMESAKSKAVRAQVLELCAQVRDIAVPLVEALGVQDKFLGPIARGETPA